MKFLQIFTRENIYFFDEQLIIKIVYIFIGFIIMWAYWTLIINDVKHENISKFNGEVVFKENSKANLSGDFEVLSTGYKYKHIETGAIFFQEDVLYIKNLIKN